MATYEMSDGYQTDMSSIDFSVLFHGTSVVATKKMYVLSFGDGYVDFRGEGFKYSRDGTPVKGTVEGYAAYDVADYQALSFGGFDVSVKTFVKAASTISKVDDQKLLAEMLSGNDDIIGADMADGLMGYKGNDTLYGGGGGDAMFGGPGRDTYAYFSAGESTLAEMDLIIGFSRGDKIGVSVIADFEFIGQGLYDGGRPQLGYTHFEGDTYVNADVDGDAVTDFAIKLEGMIALTSGDFI